MIAEPEMFPMTRIERAELFLAHFEELAERAEKSLIHAQTKYAEALRLRDMAGEDLLRARMDTTIPAAMTSCGAVVTVNTDCDPITGEVASLKSGDEKCEVPKPPDPVVFVQPPGGGCFKRIEVGEYTTYGELVADWLSENLIDLDVEAFELVSDGGMSLPLNRAIVSASYGGRYYIQAKPTGAELAEHEAIKAQEPAA